MSLDTPDQSGSDRKLISFVIPVFNEFESLVELHQKIKKVSSKLHGFEYEVIFVDDGSVDSSWEQISKLVAEQQGRVRAVRLRRNFGKSIALGVGFAEAVGEIVVTLDADLQDDPEELPKLIEVLEQGYDLVSGWKKIRHDPISKTLPSKVFNLITAKLTGIKLHDFNSGFKLYRRKVLDHLRLLGDRHRFIPVLAHNLGFRIAEVAVKHHPRKYGRSKFGWERFGRGLIDLLSVMAVTRYLQRPGHLFGGFAFCAGLFGAGALIYLSILWLIGLGPIGNRPLLLFAILGVLLCGQFLSFAILAELMITHSNSGRRTVSAQLVAERLEHQSKG